MVRTFLYSIWIFLAVILFLFALWAKLESISKKTPRSDINDLWKSGFFVSLCVGIAIVIDYFFLDSIYEAIFPEFIPQVFLQIMLLPLVLLIAGKLTGGKEKIRISKAPHPSQSKRK